VILGVNHLFGSIDVQPAGIATYIAMITALMVIET
jgi:hypothetical protein